MRTETVKSIILFSLIAISLVLSFELWSYQPNYTDIMTRELIPEVDVGGSEENKQSLIEPSEIIFHVDNRYYGLEDPKEQHSLFKWMGNWELAEFSIDRVEDDTQYEDKDVEVIFPNALNMQLVGGVFNFQEQNVEIPTWSFQRFFITFDDENKNINIEFYSIDGRDMAKAVVHNAKYYEQLQTLSEQEELMEYVLLPNEESRIFLPANKVTLTRLSTTYTTIRSDQLVNILFSDPAVVNQSSTSNLGKMYFTDNSQLRIHDDGSKMEYVSPQSEETSWMTSTDLLQFSMNHINDHKGWTDEYHLNDINESNNQIIYQLYYQGYPVFSAWNLSTIEQRWNKQRLIEYNRPLFRLGDPLNENQVELPSGKEIIRYLGDNDMQDDIRDIQVGYKLNYVSDERFIELEPSWFINMNGNWRELYPNNTSAMKGGN